MSMLKRIWSVIVSFFSSSDVQMIVQVFIQTELAQMTPQQKALAKTIVTAAIAVIDSGQAKDVSALTNYLKEKITKLKPEEQAMIFIFITNVQKKLETSKIVFPTQLKVIRALLNFINDSIK